MDWRTQQEADYFTPDEPMPVWFAIIAALFVGAFLGFVAWQAVYNLPAVLDFIAPDRHTTVEEGIARVDAREMKRDPTFDPICAYASDAWCAARIGVSLDRFRRTLRPKMERDGFPPKDPITGLTLKADMNAWLEKRRRVADPDHERLETSARTGEVNLAAL